MWDATIGNSGVCCAPTRRGKVTHPYSLWGTADIAAKSVGALFDARFPLGTFLVTVSGSFLLGLLGGWLAGRLVPNSDHLRLALGVGFLGAFTTFSTFEFETHALLEDGVWLAALMNIVLSVCVGLIALRAGVVVAKTWLLG